MTNISMIDTQFLVQVLQKAAINVYRDIGPGHSEAIYQKCMCLHLRECELKYDTEVVLPIQYLGHQVGWCRADIVVRLPGNVNIPVELKALVGTPRKTERTQLRIYMKLLGAPEGILINFPQPSNNARCVESIVTCEKVSHYDEKDPTYLDLTL